MVLLGLWLDGHGDHGIRERWGLEENRIILVAKRVTGGDVFDTHNGGDITRVAGVDIFALVGLNLDEAADALALVCAWVVNGVAFGELAGVNAEENEFSNERIAPELESERAELGVVVRDGFHGLAVVRVLSLGWGNVERAGEVVQHSINEVLNAFVFEGGSAGDGHEFIGNRLATDGCLELLDADGLFLEEEHADFLVEVAHLRDEVLVSGLSYVFQILWDFLDGVGRTHRVVVMVNDDLLVDDVDLAFEVIFFSNRDEDWPGVGAEFLAHRVHGVVEIRACAVHFIHEGDAGHTIFGGLAPDGFRLGLHACHAAEHGDGSVENAE